MAAVNTESDQSSAADLYKQTSVQGSISADVSKVNIQADDVSRSRSPALSAKSSNEQSLVQPLVDEPKQSTSLEKVERSSSEPLSSPSSTGSTKLAASRCSSTGFSQGWYYRNNLSYNFYVKRRGWYR